MFKFINKIRTSVEKLDEFTTKNKCMTNPFNKPENKTIAWCERPSLFNKINYR